MGLCFVWGPFAPDLLWSLLLMLAALGSTMGVGLLLVKEWRSRLLLALATLLAFDLLGTIGWLVAISQLGGGWVPGPWGRLFLCMGFDGTGLVLFGLVRRAVPTCPHCGGGVVVGKAVCRHCGREIAH